MEGELIETEPAPITALVLETLDNDIEALHKDEDTIDNTNERFEGQLQLLLTDVTNLQNTATGFTEQQITLFSDISTKIQTIKKIKGEQNKAIDNALTHANSAATIAIQLYEGYEQNKGEQLAIEPQREQQQLQLQYLAEENESLKKFVETNQLVITQADNLTHTLQLQLDEANVQLQQIQEQYNSALVTIEQGIPNRDEELLRQTQLATTRENRINQLDVIVTNQNKQLEAQQNALQTLNNDFQTQLNTRVNQLTEEARITAQNALVTLESVRADAERRRTEIEQRLTLANEETQALESTIKANEQQLELATAELEQRDKRLAIANRNFETVREQLATVTSESNERQLTLNTQLSENQRIIRDLQQKYEEAQTVNAQFLNTVSNLENQLATVNLQNEAELQLSLRAREDEVTTLQNQAIEYQTEISRLTQEEIDLRNSLQTAQTQVDTLTKANEDLATQNTASKSALSTVQTELDNAQGNLTLAQIDVSQRQQELNAARRDVERLTNDLTQMTNLQNDTNKQRIALQVQVNTLQTQISDITGRLTSAQKTNETLSLANISEAERRKELLTAQTSLITAQNEVKRLTTALATAQNQVKTEKAKESKLVTTQKNEEQQLLLTQATNKTLTTESQQAKRDLANLRNQISLIHVFTLDPVTGVITEEKPQSFDLNNPLQSRVLILGQAQQRLLKELLPAAIKLRATKLYENKRFTSLFSANLNRVYIAQTEPDFYTLFNQCSTLPLPPIVTTSTSTTSTTSTTGVTTVGTLALGAPVNLQTHETLLNQHNWQIVARDVSDLPGRYIVEIHFRTGLREQLHFIAKNVHLLENPIEAEGEPQYVIDLTRPTATRNMRYISLGDLMRNAIHARGNLSVSVTDKTTGQVIKEEDVEVYNFLIPETKPYGTKVVLKPSDDITLFARVTGRDTYLLETILVGSV